MPPVTAKASPNASRSPFHASFSNARPPKYPSSDAYKAQMSAATASNTAKRRHGNASVPAARVMAVRPPGMKRETTISSPPRWVS